MPKVKHARLILLALALCAGSAWAGPGPDPEPAGMARGDQQAQLDLFINGDEKDTALVVLRDGDVLVAPDDLTRAGFASVAGARVQIAGRDMVSLRSLAPDVEFSFDERALAVRLKVAPSLLGNSVIDLRSASRPQDMRLHRDGSAFANYSLQLDDTGGASAFAEAGASWKGGLLYSGLSRTPDGRVVRGLTNLTYDEPDRLRRWIAGDAVVSDSTVGGNTVLTGLSLSREYSLDPYYVHGPLPRTQGFALTPSTVDVYVNGVLVRQQQVKAGTFDLLNLPVDTGNGTYRTVVRDAFGRSQEVSGRYYFSSGVLGTGLSDYSAQVGLRRENFGTASFDYAGLGFAGHYRRGLTDHLTLGGRIEGGRGLLSGGPTLTAGLPFGELDLSVAASGGQGGLGSAASLGYSYLSRRFGANALLRYISDSYANLSLAPTSDRARLQATLFASMPISATTSLGVEAQGTRQRDAGYSGLYALRGDMQVGRATSISISAGVADQRGTLSPQATISLTHFFGELTTASAGASQKDGRSGSNLVVQRTLPAGSGFGYRVSGDSTSSSAEAMVQAQTSHGQYQAEYHRSGDRNSALAQASGGVVFIGGNAFASRPVESGFALIQVPGVEGVRGYLNNQEIGRTDSRGNLLVPDLAPYYGNRLRIEGTDVPIEYELGALEQVVGTPLRGGAKVVFDVKRSQSVAGTLQMEGGKVPAFGELRLDFLGGQAVSPVSDQGQFWLEDVPAGQHRGLVEFRDGFCNVDLTVPASKDRIVDVGAVRCTMDRVAAITSPASR
ncbi:MAG: fimbria/pilus outer membrane usher protein [Myxococcales bacterium]